MSVTPTVDPLVKREQFAVSLRRQKKQEIIKQKRQLLHKANQNDQMLYHDCEQFLLEAGFELKAVIRAQVPELEDLSGF